MGVPVGTGCAEIPRRCKLIEVDTAHIINRSLRPVSGDAREKFEEFHFFLVLCLTSSVGGGICANMSFGLIQYDCIHTGWPEPPKLQPSGFFMRRAVMKSLSNLLCRCERKYRVKAFSGRPSIQSNTTGGPISRRTRKPTVLTPMTDGKPLDITGVAEAKRAIICLACERTTRKTRSKWNLSVA